MSSLLEARDIAVRYGAVEAVQGVSFDVAAGEVLGICGDNGAGKSSLIKVLAGAQTPSAGEIRLDDAPVVFASPAAALRAGIATIYQDLALASRLSIYQNVFLGSELTRRSLLPGLRVLDKAAMRSEARKHLGTLKIELPSMDAPVSGLSGGQRQAVAISRALRWQARLVLLDEPTAALGVQEKARVLDYLRHLKAAGVTVLLISHNLDDVLATCDRVLVLKNGRKVGDRPVAELSEARLSQLIMTGR
ncbi:MAG: ATP-binding cassette domain-containing protein [Kiloniellales bacterium]|nr:ATP-binding cassette domain-containing protein [Kiloniellales bacterium]